MASTKLLVMGMMMSIAMLAMFASVCLGQYDGYTGNAIDNTKGNYNNVNDNTKGNYNYNNDNTKGNYNHNNDNNSKNKDDDLCLGPFLKQADVLAVFENNDCCKTLAEKIKLSKTCNLIYDLDAKIAGPFGLSPEVICEAFMGVAGVGFLTCKLSQSDNLRN